MPVAHNLPLLSTLATGLSLAFLFGLIVSKLRIPPIVGYLIAGIAIGPYTPGFVGDMKIAEELSEIGIVLLMFGVGLHFSFKDLLEVRKIALPGAVVQMAAATGMGALLACKSWGWPLESGIMFGLSLSVASTVVLLRSLEEHNLTQSNHGRIAVGWLIVEDVAMIFALVLIPALGLHAGDVQAGKPLARELLAATGKVLLFAVIMFYGGRRFLPWILTIVARTQSRELFTLAVFAAAMGTAYGAAILFDISFALGAFFAGMMIRESDLNHEVADRALPFQDAFAVLFFVAVGMLFDPLILVERPLDVLLVVAIIMIGKSLAAMLIVLLFRYPLKTSLIVSAGLAQIGEFSFVLVALGTAHGLLPEEASSLVLAGALFSIALNPFAFHATRLAYAAMGHGHSLGISAAHENLTHLRRGEKAALKDLVILVGHGKTGRYISQNIQASHIDLVVIDSNRQRIDNLRDRGFHAIAGDATRPETLHAAAIHKAVAIVIATQDPFEARRIFENARKLNPGIKILVHAHNDEEEAYFKAQDNVDMILLGPREIARSITNYLNNMSRRA